SVRGPHQGQQSTRTAPTGRTHDCKRPLRCTPNDLLPGGGHPHMNRREFITLLGGAAAAWPLAARGPQAHGLITSARIAFLGAESASTNQHFFDAFRQGMREYGYLDGQNVTFLERWAEGRSERFPEIIEELISLKADVILAVSVSAALAAKTATT